MNGSEPIGWVIIEGAVIFIATSVLLSLTSEICSAVAFRITRRHESHFLTGILYLCVTAIMAGVLRLTQSHIIQAQDASQHWQYWVYLYLAIVCAGTAAVGIVYLVSRTIYNLWTGMIDAIRGELTLPGEFPRRESETAVSSSASARTQTPDLARHT